ncbi:hypothetical protein C6W19_05260 [Bacillus sp. RJGP41]|nr:hypothetical protein C6W19_05260 [Bacillus sp. RJGP41]
MDGRELRSCFGKSLTGVTIVSWFDGKFKRGYCEFIKFTSKIAKLTSELLNSRVKWPIHE